MNPYRQRAKEHFPMVLLTLLSIVQALALELWWQFVSESNLPAVNNLAAFTLWLQIVAAIVCIVAVWIIYASTAMRFRWTPSVSDSVFPFFVGILQFMMIDALYFESRGAFLILAGMVFFSVRITLQLTFRRARNDPDNKDFFEKIERATLKDFVPIVAFSAFLAGAGAITNFYEVEWVGMLVSLIFLLLLLYQMTAVSRLWAESMNEELQTKAPEKVEPN